MNFETQSSRPRSSASLHVAIIMDGSGRWATRKERSRSEGHAAGAANVSPIVGAAIDLGIGILTLFVLSSDNFRRPAAEVGRLLDLLHDFLLEHTPDLVHRGVRLSVIGARDRLPPHLVRRLRASERLTRAGRRLHLRLAVDYSARDAILAAASTIQGWHTNAPADGAPPPLTREGFAGLLEGAEPVDLLIRTGGERRLSDFMLWESAYAELLFVDTAWPDFTPEHLGAALSEFEHRNRRFGSITSPDPAPGNLADDAGAAESRSSEPSLSKRGALRR